MCATRKDSELEWLAKDHPEPNPITIKPETESDAAKQFSWVPLSYCSPPGCPFPIKSLAVSTCVSSDNSFPSVRQEPSFGPWKGSAFLQQKQTSSSFTEEENCGNTVQLEKRLFRWQGKFNRDPKKKEISSILETYSNWRNGNLNWVKCFLPMALSLTFIIPSPLSGHVTALTNTLILATALILI